MEDWKYIFRSMALSGKGIIYSCILLQLNLESLSMNDEDGGVWR